MRKFLLISLLITVSLPVFSDDLINATDIFNKVSDLYAGFNDFQATIRISIGDKTQSGVLFYNSRNLMKIEFYEPRGQVIVVDREKMQIYLPSHQTILDQKFDDSGTSMASAGGLSLLKNNYIVSFAEAGIVSLSTDSNEKVYKLSLYPYAGSKEGFKYIILSVLPDSYLIRRIEAVNLKNTKIIFDYGNIIINPGIPYTFYSIDPPNLTNVYPNFLYGEDQ